MPIVQFTVRPGHLNTSRGLLLVSGLGFDFRFLLKTFPLSLPVPTFVSSLYFTLLGISLSRVALGSWTE